MKERFTRMYEYNLWANKLFSEKIKSEPFDSEDIERIFSHIANAQLVWLSRITQVEGEIPGVWDVHPMPEAVELLKKGSELWLEFIYSQEEYEDVIHYTNSKGVEYDARLSDILTHVANHGTHHRGNLATLLRQNHIEPPMSDFIFYVRSEPNQRA